MNLDFFHATRHLDGKVSAEFEHFVVGCEAHSVVDFGRHRLAHVVRLQQVDFI